MEQKKTQKKISTKKCNVHSENSTKCTMENTSFLEKKIRAQTKYKLAIITTPTKVASTHTR